jgi:cysteinyl-tRNA synthetase
MSKKKTIEKIAKEKLRLETLQTRWSDELDFHDMSVWQLKDALEAAYEAGRKAATKK